MVTKKKTMKKSLEEMKTSELIRSFTNNPGEQDAFFEFCDRQLLDKDHSQCENCPFDGSHCLCARRFLCKQAGVEMKDAKGLMMMPFNPEYECCRQWADLERSWGVREFLFSLAYAYELEGD